MRAVNGGNGGDMATKRRFTRDAMADAIKQYGGNVRQIAAAHGCTVKTIYNTIDRYGMRGDLDAARSSALDAAAIALRKSPIGIRRALIMLAESNGRITKAKLVQLFSEPVSTARPFSSGGKK